MEQSWSKSTCQVALRKIKKIELGGLKKDKKIELGGLKKDKKNRAWWP